MVECLKVTREKALGTMIAIIRLASDTGRPLLGHPLSFPKVYSRYTQNLGYGSSLVRVISFINPD